MSETTKKRRKRSRHRAYVTKKLTKVKELTKNFSPDVTIILAKLKLTLFEKIETNGRLDELILEDLEREFEGSSEVKDEIYGGIAAIEELLAHPKEPHHSHGQKNESAPASKAIYLA